MTISIMISSNHYWILINLYWIFFNQINFDVISLLMCCIFTILSSFNRFNLFIIPLCVLNGFNDNHFNFRLLFSFRRFIFWIILFLKICLLYFFRNFNSFMIFFLAIHFGFVFIQKNRFFKIFLISWKVPLKVISLISSFVSFVVNC